MIKQTTKKIFAYSTATVIGFYVLTSTGQTTRLSTERSGETVTVTRGDTFSIVLPDQVNHTWVTSYDPEIIQQKITVEPADSIIQFEAYTEGTTQLRIENRDINIKNSNSNILIFDFLIEVVN